MTGRDKGGKGLGKGGNSQSESTSVVFVKSTKIRYYVYQF